MSNRRKLQVRDFVLLSLCIHAAFVIGSWLSFKAQPPKAEVVTFEIVEPSAPVEVAQTEEDRKKKSAQVLKNQIVDQDDRPLNDEVPEDARFLSKHNQVVKKQTMAQNRGEFKNRATKETMAGRQGEKKTLSLSDLKPSFDIAKSVERQAERERQFEKLAEDGLLPAQQKKTAQNQAAKSGDGAEERSAGGDASQTLDYIRDIDPGLETILSTKEFVYYSYFNRIRSRLNQYWTDKVRQKLSEMYKKGRSIASSDDKVTKCLITLDTSGRLLKVQIIGDSGVHELDEAAVEAFKAAAPFLNPPKGMIDADGTIKIRWDFILEA